MKIVQVVHSFLPHTMAGTEVYTYNLSRELSKRHNIFIFYRINDTGRSEYELNQTTFNGLEIYTINNTFRDCDSFEAIYKNNVIGEKLGEFLDEVKPDIIHIQHLIFLSTTIIHEAKIRSIPVLFTLHDYWLICPQWHFLRKDLGICSGHNDFDCVNCLVEQLSISRMAKKSYHLLRKVIPGFLIQLLKGIYIRGVRTSFLSDGETFNQIRSRKQHMKEICNLVDLFIAPSQFLRRKFLEFGIPEEKIILSLYGINTDLFKDFKRSNSDRIRFGFIGTLLPAKGVHLLIKAFNRVKDRNAELKIYGKLFPYKGFEYYPRYIKRLVKNKNIEFKGEFNNKDIARIFAGIDVLIVPSIWNENLPLVILEALLTKTPVIASDIGGISELIENGKNGILFPPGDEIELYKSIMIFIGKPNFIEQLRMNEIFSKSIEENSMELEDIYKKIK